MSHSATNESNSLNDLSLCHIIENGFPTKPLCSAYSSNLSALAIGTQTGEVRLVGKQHVQFLYNLRSSENTEIENVFDEGHVSHLTFLSDKTSCKIAAIINYVHLVVLELVNRVENLFRIFYTKR